MALKRAKKPVRTGTSRKAKKRVVQVDFEGVESGGGGGFHIPEGEYGVKCIEVEEGESEAGNPKLAWKFQGTTGKAKGKTFYYHTALTEEALWKVRETLEGLGVEVPDSVLDIDLDELEGLEGTVEVEDDEWKGKLRSKIARFVIGEAEEGEEEEEDETDKKPGKGGKKPAGKKKQEVKYSTDEVKEMSEEELADVIEKHELEVDLDEFKILTKKRNAVLAALEEAELIED